MTDDMPECEPLNEDDVGLELRQLMPESEILHFIRTSAKIYEISEDEEE